MSNEENQIEDAQIIEETPSVEEQARAKGWIPPEEAVEKGVNPNDVVDAATYMDREPFIKRIKLLDQRNRTMAQKLDAIINRFDQAETEGYQRAIEELEIQREEAYNELDTQQVRAIDHEIDRQKKALQDTQQRAQQQAQDPEALDFVQNNKDWWGKDVAAMQFAVATEAALKNQNPSMALTDVYDEVQRRVDVFRGVDPKTSTTKETTPKASFVATPQRGGAASGGAKESYGFNDLNNGAKDVYMSMRQYRMDEFGEDYSVDQFIESQIKAGAVDIDELTKK